MISDAKKTFLDIVTKQYPSCRKIFFFQQEHFSYCKKKSCAKKKNLGAGIKTVCHFIKRNFLGSIKKYKKNVSPTDQEEATGRQVEVRSQTVHRAVLKD